MGVNVGNVSGGHPLVNASANIKTSADAQQQNLGNNYVVVKRFIMGVSGTINIYMNLWGNAAGINAQAEVKVNGTLMASVVTTANTTPTAVSYPAPINVHVGDVVEVQIANANSADTAYINNCRLGYDILQGSGSDAVALN